MRKTAHKLGIIFPLNVKRRAVRIDFFDTKICCASVYYREDYKKKKIEEDSAYTLILTPISRASRISNKAGAKCEEELVFFKWKNEKKKQRKKKTGTEKAKEWKEEKLR